ncbi:TolC family protein [Rhodohalobacter sp. SW132]|nr:TolC family protein [Rhodohalobacter sp. SW132]
MRKLIVISAFLLVPMIVQAQTHNLTLNDAIQLALENNYQLKQADNNLDLADTRIWSARADFLPSLSANFNGSRDAGLQFIQEDLAFEDRSSLRLSGGLSSQVTVFNGFSNIASLRQSEINRDAQELDLQRLRESIIFDTASRYLQVVLDKELLKIAESSLEASESQLQQVEAQVEVGSRPTVDLYNQEATVANDELAVIQSENSLEVSIARLIRIMQDPEITDIEVSVPDTDELALMPVELDMDEMIESALQSRRDYLAQEKTIESNEQNRRIVRADFMPSLTFSASIGSNYSDQRVLLGETIPFGDQFFDQNVTRSVGFSLSIPIFNRWNTRANYQNAQVQLKNSELELDNIRFQISEEVRQAYNDYIAISKELESTEKSLIAAERAYETEQQRYEIGSTTLIELNQANANYVQAQSNRIQSVYNFIFQEQLLDFYIGRLDESLEFN